MPAFFNTEARDYRTSQGMLISDNGTHCFSLDRDILNDTASRRGKYCRTTILASLYAPFLGKNRIHDQFLRIFKAIAAYLIRLSYFAMLDTKTSETAGGL